ncbi:retinoic acid-induced protein 2 [Athene cunicularia]|uniref:retinoic acid-induced protein 2 n=1 Tax=Athene cunicularia TaxID=194338 RepID=UPI000EF67AAD|nr:retinoic acid-induced protein 2 [Athene cunicularia]
MRGKQTDRDLRKFKKRKCKVLQSCTWGETVPGTSTCWGPPNGKQLSRKDLRSPGDYQVECKNRELLYKAQEALVLGLHCTWQPATTKLQVPIPVPHSAEAKAAPDLPKPPLFTPNSCKGTQTPLEKEETKPFDLLHPREFPQLSRHTVIKMGGENEALDLSMKGPPVPRASEAAPPPPPEDGALDLSLASCRKPGGPHGEAASTSPATAAEAGAHPAQDKLPGPAAPFAPCKPQEASGKVEGRGASSGPAELLRQPQKWLVEQAGRAGCEPKAGNNIEIVSTSQTAKVIVSVKDAVPTIFCGKIKGLSGVSTKNFSFKRDLPQDSVLQCYDVKSPPEPRDSAEALRKPVKNRSVKLKKMNSPEIHILPIKKQRLAAFFPRK